ncbi:MAG: AMP-binding protein [Oscillatoriales cyanobacterium RM1_1_9]|nr:AMP-binding protein [Oscillatoriales cyanobacterium RM1_1_9]
MAGSVSYCASGGAPAWSELLDQAREQHIQLAPTYGMTETAAQVVTLKPQDFLAGNNSVGQALPHAKVTVYQDLGEVCAINQPGLITIQTNSLMWGYYGESSLLNSTALNPDRCFQTDDLGYFDQQGYLTIIGRNSQKIITGGENVFPGEIELAIQATNLVEDVCVVGLPDRHWGQVVAAVYVPKPFTSAALLNAKLQGQLSSYKLPKHWIEIPQIPRNPQGKINRPQLEEIAKSSL